MLATEYNKLASILIDMIIFVPLLVEIFCVVLIVKNRKKKWTSAYFSVLSMIITDIGVLILRAVISTLRKSSFFTWCLTSGFIILATQYVSMLHLFGLCLQRCLTIQRRMKINARVTKRRTIIFMVGIWLISLVIVGVPYYVWFGNYRKCNIILMLQENTMMNIFFGAVYSVPFILTNIIYAYSVISLHKTAKHKGRVEPTVGSSSTTDSRLTHGISKAPKPMSRSNQDGFHWKTGNTSWFEINSSR